MIQYIADSRVAFYALRNVHIMEYIHYEALRGFSVVFGVLRLLFEHEEGRLACKVPLR